MNSARIEVIKKIKKLLSLAEGEANLNEALAAAEIAQRLILLHAVADSELQSSEVTERNGEPIIDLIEKFNIPFSTWRNPPDYIQVLFNVIASHNNCAIYLCPIEEGGVKCIVFSIVGQRSSIEFVYWMAQWMNVQIFSAYQSQQDMKDGTYRDFYLGACKKLDQRLSKSSGNLEQTAKDEGISESQVRSAIVRLSDTKQEVEKKMREMAEMFEEKKSALADDNLAFARGFNEADKLILETQKTLATEEVAKLGE